MDGYWYKLCKDDAFDCKQAGRSRLIKLGDKQS